MFLRSLACLDRVVNGEYMRAMNITADASVAANYEKAYFPIAPFMPYGPHLPMTTGILIAEALAVAIGSRIGAFVLPVQPFGAFLENNEKYNICVDSGLLYDLVLDIASNLRNQGFKRLVLHQGFRGLSILYPLTRHINSAGIIQTVLVNPFDPAEAQGGVLEGAGNVHACELQTSLMLYLNPKLVDEDKMRGADFVPDVPPHYLDYKPLSAYCPGGVWGRPSLASAEKGRKFFDIAVESSVAYINDVFEFMSKNGGYAGSLSSL